MTTAYPLTWPGGFAPSPEYALIWRPQDMPSGPPIFALRASARRTSGNACSGWPTPQISRGKYQIKNGAVFLKLEGTAALVEWPTPQASADRATSGGRGPATNPSLRKAALRTIAGWPTPRESDRRKGRHLGAQPNIRGTDLPTIAGWSTPNAADAWVPETISENTLRRGDPLGSRRSTSGNLSKDAVAFGPAPNGAPAAMAGRGVLNPNFSLWLMGFPLEWSLCAPTSWRRSNKK